jgi:hypothetical protein
LDVDFAKGSTNGEFFCGIRYGDFVLIKPEDHNNEVDKHIAENMLNDFGHADPFFQASNRRASDLTCTLLAHRTAFTLSSAR